MKRLVHVLIAVATGLEQASLVWESLKLQTSQPLVEPQVRKIGFKPAESQDKLAPREYFARDA